MELLKNLELMEVSYDDGMKKATLTFLDKERGEIREVNFNKQVYEDGKYVDSDEKSAKVDEWCKDYFDTTFDNLASKIGTTKDVYAYDTFSSLWEVEQVNKFTKEMNGKIYTSAIEEVKLDDYFIKVRYKISGKLYESKQTFGKYNEDMKKWFKNPVERAKAFDKFNEKFGMMPDSEEIGTLIGTKIIVEVKCAFKKFYYGDIKPLPKE